jgi:hypothetical protein
VKKIIFAALVGLVATTHAFAGEEIQLAAAIGSSSPTGSASSNKSDDDDGAAAVPATKGMDTSTMAIAGGIAAVVLVAISGNSTSNH